MQLDDIAVKKDNIILDGLNTPQREAVLTTDRHCLVLAGAGTGKTRALTSRIAYILQEGLAAPNEIMAVTFTNKAANEMKERISKLTGYSTRAMWIGTFHSVSVRLLRTYGDYIGLPNAFSIIDKDDQLRLVKQIIKDNNINDRKPPKAFLGNIDSIKNKGLNFDSFLQHAPEFPALGTDKAFVKVFEQYQAALDRTNTLDFNDIILKTTQLLTKHQEVQERFIKTLKFIHVDEYQDTNAAQYLWLRALTHRDSILCCVGDDDQSIYGWRGAEVSNLLRFERDFPNAKVIRLEQNYRSTHHILGAASRLIENNAQRLGKKLWTEYEPIDAKKVLVKSLKGGIEEAIFVAEQIKKLINIHNIPADDIAVLVRAGRQTRLFEERFLTVQIPHQLVGAMRFYERLEIKDIMAYLRLLYNPSDNLAFERALTSPKRGIGVATLRSLHDVAIQHNISLYDAVLKLLETDDLKPKHKSVLGEFTYNLKHWTTMLNDYSLKDVATAVINESGYRIALKAEKTLEAEGRLENLKELESSLEQYESLEDFIEHVSLVNENASADQEAKVSVMTLHAAKGLEFDHVFLSGWEEGVFPNRRAIDELGAKGVEEERRLAYVGLTRAKKAAIITHVNMRPMGGTTDFLIPSRFITEIKSDHVNYDRGEVTNSYTPKPRFNMFSASPTPPPQYDEFNQDTGNHFYADDTTNPYKPGTKITHKVYGNGEILKVSNDKADVFFQHYGRKRVLTSFLEVINDISTF